MMSATKKANQTRKMLRLQRMVLTLAICLFGLAALPTFSQSLEHPLRPPKTSSPQATLQSFVNAMDEVHTIAT